MILHPKILEFRNKVGTSPIKYAYRKTALKQPATSTKEDEGRTLKQYFAIWGIKDDYGTMPLKGCFSKSIRERGPASEATYKITALYMHRQGDSVGLPAVLEEDETGLYAEIPVVEGIQVADELVIRHKRGLCNNGSYGFDYVWDKMEYDEKADAIVMKECDLFEISFVTIGAQTETYGVRNSDGTYTDDFLLEDTEALIRKVARKDQMELRSLIDRHIALAKSQPNEQKQDSLDTSKPTQGGIDYNYLLSKF